MRSLPRIALDVPVNPAVDALAALERVMLELDYTGRCRSDAKTIVRRTGCVADCVPDCLDASDLAVCEAEYVDALPDVHQSDPSWNDRGVYVDLDSIQDAAAGRHFPLALSIVPPELDAARAIVERDAAERAEMLAFGHAEILRVNAASAVPMAVCRECDHPFGDDQASWLWRGRCCTCEINRMEDLLRKIVERRGRKGTLRALRRLAK